MYDNMKSKGFNNPHENKKFFCHINLVHLFEIVCNMETIKTEFYIRLMLNTWCLQLLSVTALLCCNRNEGKHTLTHP